MSHVSVKQIAKIEKGQMNPNVTKLRRQIKDLYTRDGIGVFFSPFSKK